MKKTISIFILLFVVTNLNAQFSEKNAIYPAAEFYFGNYLGVNLNLNYVFNEKYSCQVGYSEFYRESRSKPEDLTSLLGLISDIGDNDYMQNYLFLVGKIFSLNEYGTTRLNTSLGIGYTNIRERTNWEFVDNPLGDFYTSDIDKYNTVSLIINPKFEFLFTRHIGLTLSPMLQINKDRTFIGIGFGVMTGILRGKNI